MLITALQNGQLPPSSATRRAQFSQNLACPQSTKAKPSIGANRNTSQHRNGLSAAKLVLLAPTLRPTRWQQSVSTARRRRRRRRRRRNCRRVGWAVFIVFNSPPSLTETTCLLLTYVLNLGVNAVDHTVPSYNTGLTLNTYVCSCSTPVRHFPVRHFPVLQIPVLQIQLSSSGKNSPTVLSRL